MRLDDVRWTLTKEMNWDYLNEEVLIWSNIGRAYWNVSLRHINDKLRYKKVIKNYIRHMHDRYEPNGIGLLLHGPYGTGKTSLASLVAMCCLAKGGRSFFVRATDLIRAVKSFTPVCIRDGVPILEMAKKVNILVIDDLEVDDPDIRKIETVMRWRDDEDLSTIITSNIQENRNTGERPKKTDNWLQSIAAQRLIGVKIVGPEDGGHDWRRNPPEVD